MTDLHFYTRPFHIDYGGGWVYDAKGNFVFQFEKSLRKDKIQRQNIIFRLNALDKDTEEIPDYKLHYDHKNAEILDMTKGELFITIRGWGGLTGTGGGHGFSAEKASDIQKRFAEWLIERLTKTKTDNEK